ADTAELIKEYEKKLVDIRQQKNTLSTQIQEMDTQMYLTGLTIQRSEAKIIETQSEIEKLGSRIDNLDSSLNTLSKLLLQQITKSYKMRSISLVELLFETKDMNDLANKIKYLRSSQNNNQKLLVQVQEAKSSYEEQKVIREQKKQELDQLIISLNNQKVELKKQQALKQKLLADTNNDETTYQSLLTQAQAQLKGFKTFVSSSGSDSTIASNAFGNGSDGAYYSQRDARWANQTIGGSQESILNVGCLVTSVAMFAKKNGQNVSPTEIASDYSRFSGNFAYMKNPWPGVAGKTYVDFYGSRANINQELDSGNYVIVGVYKYSCDYGGNHFVLLTKRDGDDYIMHDPIYGPDLKFSSHYSTICSAATFK
ncbi:hypothetical protein COZ40_03420, partial [Candidatus Roizmanbacteria bacterium CG_4_10_14_3_um_filter_39_13]